MIALSFVVTAVQMVTTEITVPVDKSAVSTSSPVQTQPVPVNPSITQLQTTRVVQASEKLNCTRWKKEGIIIQLHMALSKCYK